MGVPNKIRPGVPITKYPAGTHNWLVDQVTRLLADRGDTPGIPESPTGAEHPRIKNDTATDILKPFGVLKLDGPLNDPTVHTHEPAKGVRIKGALPEEGEPFAILQRSCKQNQLVDGITEGITWARVDIKDEADTTAGPIDDDADKLESGKGGATILWKPDGVTGEQLVIVQVGGAQAAASVAGNIALARSGISAAEFDAAGGDPFGWSVMPGISGVFQESPVPATEGVVLLDWERDAATKDDYFDAEGKLAPYKLPLQKLTVVFEQNLESAGPPPVYTTDPAYRGAINNSGTDIRASAAEPIVVGGFVQEITQGDPPIEYKVFVITNIFDMRALPGFVKGTVVADDAQAPYHEGNAIDFKLGHGECVEPAP